MLLGVPTLTVASGKVEGGMIVGLPDNGVAREKAIQKLRESGELLPGSDTVESRIVGKTVVDVETKNDGRIFSMIMRFSDGSHVELFVVEAQQLRFELLSGKVERSARERMPIR